MNAPLTLRPARADDQAFLYQVYASTREDEMQQTGWDEAQKDEFLRMQFDAQHIYYHEQFPDAEYDLILSNNKPVGRLYVHRRDDEIRIVDIALLPEHRRDGIGSTLLKELITEASRSGKPIQIHVEKFNPALGLYKRMGFVETGDTGVYLLMTWTPANAPATPAKGTEA